MAARSRRKGTYHPTPSLLAALTFFKGVGMKKAELVNIADGWAEYEREGARFRRRVNDAPFSCRLAGEQLLLIMTPIQSQVIFKIDANKLTIDTEAGERFSIAADPPLPMIAVNVLGATAAGVSDRLVTMAKLADAHNTKLHLADGCLNLNAARSLVVKAPVGIPAPARVINAKNLLKLDKVSGAQLSGFGWCPTAGGDWQLALFFGTSYDDPNATIIMLGEAPTEPVNDAILGYAPPYIGSVLPATFPGVLKQFKSLSADGIVTFREGVARLEDGNGGASAERRLEMHAEGTYRIRSLLALDQFTERVDFSVTQGVPCMWFRREDITGVLASVRVGNVDDEVPKYETSHSRDHERSYSHPEQAQDEPDLDLSNPVDFGQPESHNYDALGYQTGGNVGETMQTHDDEDGVGIGDECDRSPRCQGRFVEQHTAAGPMVICDTCGEPL